MIQLLKSSSVPEGRQVIAAWDGVKAHFSVTGLSCLPGWGTLVCTQKRRHGVEANGSSASWHQMTSSAFLENPKCCQH